MHSPRTLTRKLLALRRAQTTVILLLVGKFLAVQGHDTDCREAEALIGTYGPAARQNPPPAPVIESAPEAAMECNRLWVAIAAVGLILLAALPARPSGQHDFSRNLSASEKIFADYSKDFKALEKTQQGVEFWEIEFLDGVATTAEDRLHAAGAMLAKCIEPFPVGRTAKRQPRF